MVACSSGTGLKSADEIVAALLDAIVSDLGLTSGAHVGLLVNGLGGTPLGELYVMFNSARQWLERAGLGRHAAVLAPKLVEAAWQLARRGVKVRVVVDGIRVGCKVSGMACAKADHSRGSVSGRS